MLTSVKPTASFTQLQKIKMV